MTGTPDGLRRAWRLVEDRWDRTLEDARRLPEDALHRSVDGEWSFVETLRHLVFVTDAWVRRTIRGEAHAYHRLGLPPDHRVGMAEPGVDVRPWGIDVFAPASLEEVVAVRAERRGAVAQLIEGVDEAALRGVCAANPAPGFPPVTTVPVAVCLQLVVGEECAHHEYAVRDLARLEPT